MLILKFDVWPLWTNEFLQRPKNCRAVKKPYMEFNGSYFMRLVLWHYFRNFYCFGCALVWTMVNEPNWKSICSHDLLFFKFSLIPLSAVVRTLGSLFYNSCHRVMSLACVWVNWMTGLTDGGSHFRMRITLGVVLIRSLVFHVCVPECSRNGFGMRPYLLVQEKFVQFRQSTQNAGLCPAELLGQFLTDSAFYLLRKLCDIFLVNSRNGRVSWLAVPRIFFLCFSCNGWQLSFVSQRCHLFEGKMLRSYEEWIILYLLINLIL